MKIAFSPRIKISATNGSDIFPVMFPHFHFMTVFIMNVFRVAVQWGDFASIGDVEDLPHSPLLASAYPRASRSGCEMSAPCF